MEADIAAQVIALARLAAEADAADETSGEDEMDAGRAATGAVAVHLRLAIDWISWAVEAKTGDIVGLGSCLCVQGQSGCPKECVIGGLLFLRWGPDLSKPPRVLNSMQITVTTCENFRS